MQAEGADAAEGEVGKSGRSEESLIRSLAELRAIEIQRQQEEVAAAEAVVQARRRARETALQAAAQAARDAVAARIAVEREAELAAHSARTAAEREARLQIEAIEATERARRMVALEEHRVAAELAVAREVALRRRPRGLIALATLAIAAAAVLGWIAREARLDADAAGTARARAVTELAVVARAGDDARDALARSERELIELRARIDAVTRAAPVAPPPRPAPPRPGGRPATPRPDHRPVVPPPITISDDCLHNALCETPSRRSP
jgi:hypothetical protein